MEFGSRNIEIEKIVKKGMTPTQQKRQLRLESYMNKESKAKSFKQLLQVKKMIAKNLPKADYSREDILWMFEDLQRALKRFEKTTRNSVFMEIEGWKGKDVIEIYGGFKENFTIIEHRKNKETGDSETSKHEVSNKDINRLLFWIKKWEIGEAHKYYDFADILGVDNWETVWKRRTDIYFKLYYYPLKVLEAIGIIGYSGRGLVTKIK